MEQQAQSIQNGVTTKQQLIEKLGEPNESHNEANGAERLTWQGNRNSIDSKTFIPFYGIVAGSGATESSQLVVWVNKSGIVTNYQYNNQTVTEDTFGNKSTKKTNLSGAAQSQRREVRALTLGRVVAQRPRPSRAQPQKGVTI